MAGLSQDWAAQGSEKHVFSLVVDFNTEVTYDIGCLPFIAKTWVL